MPQLLCPVIVGREAELGVLREALAGAMEGEGRCVLLAGEPGIGKSRLAREVVGWAADNGVPVVIGRAVPAAGSAAYRPITEALSQLLRRWPVPDDPALGPWLALVQPLVPAFIDRSGTADPPASLRAEAILQLVRHTVPSGVVVVLEDLHWADPDSVALVEYLADNVADIPMLLVLTLRDSQISPALDLARRQRGRSRMTYLALDRLDDEQVAAMVRACDPDAAADAVARIEQASEGVPLLVEELLASPGLPADFAATVKARLAALPGPERGVIEAAAVLGRRFDWALLSAITGESEDAVAEGLSAGIESLLLTSHGGELRFRHALTREAILDTLLPPRQRQLAGSALAALLSARPDLDDGRRELAVDLALRADDRHRAGALLYESGVQSLSWGALATAAVALRRAADLLSGSTGQVDAELELVEALALAGRVDEAAAAGGRLITRLGNDPDSEDRRVEAHLRLAHAAVAASRWQMARHHLDQARRLAGPADPGRRLAGPADPGRRLGDVEASAAVRSRIAVLEADVAMAADDYEAARTLAEEVLETPGVSPEVRCHAFEIVGRSHRLADLPAARAAFESALVTAEAADVPLWRLRALHELGTVEMFDHAGTARLLQARQVAEQMGAMSTGAILDLQLTATFTCRWDLAACDAHATSAIVIAERLGLETVRAKAMSLLIGSASMRADLAETERYAAAAVAAAPEDGMVEGLSWGGRGVALLLGGADDAAMEPWARGIAILSKLPHGEPAALRALWPLVLAARGDRRAQGAIDEARRRGVATLHMNQAMIDYAEAIMAGRRGDVRRAKELIALADTMWTNCEAWADLARVLAGPSGASDGWVDVPRWLGGAEERFASRGLPVFERRCHELRAATSANPWSGAGISDREADVLRLVGEGLSNKEIASRLHLSPRTVEKHVESLLRKCAARSRTELVARLLPTAGAAPVPRAPRGGT